MENEFLNAALKYIAYGFHVFPLKPKSKEPQTKKGFKDASTKESMVSAWWTAYPDANIGIATGKISDLVVIDIDGEYPNDFPDLPPKATVKTPKGYHYYFKYPEGEEVRSPTKLKGHDVDVRGDGAYIVAPPSIHPDGGRYELVD